MKVLTGLTQSLKADNEDGFGFDRSHLWVVDGATPLVPHDVGGRSAAAWLRECVCTQLALAGAPWPAVPLRRVLAWLVERLVDQGQTLGVGSGLTFPSAAIALARRREDAVDVCLLGDVLVVLRAPGCPVVELTDPQFVGTEAAILSEVGERLAAGHDPAAVYRELYSLLRARRDARNTDRGLWVLGDVVEAADHAFETTVSAPPGSDLLVMTDGFARVVDPFATVPDTAALLDEVVAGRADDLLAALRAAEAADPGCVRFPRIGVSDDATVVHARL